MIKKRNIKILIVIIVVFGIYLGLMLLFANNSNDNEPPVDNPIKPIEPVEKIDKEVIVLNQNVVLLYEDEKWKNSSSGEYSSEEMQIYDGNTFVGNRYISYNYRWYVFDSDRNFYSLNNELFAFRGDYNLNVKNIFKSEVSIEEQNLVSNFLNEQSLIYSLENLELVKYESDIDDDNNLEKIIVVMNLSGLDYTVTGDEFIYTLIIDNDTIVPILNNLNESLECTPYLQKNISLNDKRFMIVGCIYPSDNGTASYIYEVKNSEYIQLLKTKAN